MGHLQTNGVEGQDALVGHVAWAHAKWVVSGVVGWWSRVVRWWIEVVVVGSGMLMMCTATHKH